MKLISHTFKAKKRSGPAAIAVLTSVFIFLSAAVVFAQVGNIGRSVATSEVVASAVDTTQCANGTETSPEDCNDTDSWVSGNVNHAKAHYKEGESVVYRAVFTGLVPDKQYTYAFQYDTTKNGKHALDYITSYNRLSFNHLVIPCWDQVCGTPHTMAIPLDPRVTAGQTSPYTGDDLYPGPDGNVGTADDMTLVDGILNSGVITMWNATINSVGTPTLVNGTYANGMYSDTSATAIYVTFTTGPGQTTAVMAWGGHISHRKDWGVDSSAVSITGSPYHTANYYWSDGTVGAADLQLASSAVTLSATIRIIKALAGNLLLSGMDFRFTHTFPTMFVNSGSTTPFGTNTFTLDVDGDQDATWPSQTTSTPFENFLPGTSMTGTISEDPAPGAYVLKSISCTEQGALGVNVQSTYDTTEFPTSSVINVNLNENEILTCTYTNSILLAAPAYVSGQVVDSFGNGIRGARVVLTNNATGEVMAAVTGSFGYFRIDEAEVENFYTLRVSHKRYAFAVDTITFTLSDNLEGIMFTANPLDLR